MNADAFRQFYDYHIRENRKIWAQHILPLAQEKFLQPVDYSIGSVRNQVVHLMSVDSAWFDDLEGVEFEGHLDPEDYSEKEQIRGHWDGVEERMQIYMDALSDEMLMEQPFQGQEANVYTWQALLHVANHGTDHRAQILRLLNDLGAETGPQDYIFYVFRNP